MIEAAEREARYCRQRLRQAPQPRGFAPQEARQVLGQRIVTRDGAVEVEQGEPARRSVARAARARWRRVRFAQATLPAAASCRSTYCRMPP